MPSMSDMKDMYRLQKEAKRIRKELKNIHVEAESGGVSLVMNAEQEIVSLTIDPSVPHEKIALHVKDVFNRAVAKAKLVASERMQGMMQQMGMPSMGGMTE